MDPTEPKATFLGEGSSDLEGRGSLYPARGDGARLSKTGVKVAFSLTFPNPKCVFPGVHRVPGIRGPQSGFPGYRHCPRARVRRAWRIPRGGKRER